MVLMNPPGAGLEITIWCMEGRQIEFAPVVFPVTGTAAGVDVLAIVMKATASVMFVSIKSLVEGTTATGVNAATVIAKARLFDFGTNGLTREVSGMITCLRVQRHFRLQKQGQPQDDYFR